MVALDAADYWGHGGGGGGGEVEQKDDGEEEKKEEQPKTFVQQKAVSNGRVAEDGDELVCSTGKKSVASVGADAARLNHFNVVS